MLPAGKFWMDSRSTSLIKSREHGDNGRGGGGMLGRAMASVFGNWVDNNAMYDAM
jgi:hypothetical protein